jgi:hypothetical protein
MEIRWGRADDDHPSIGARRGARMTAVNERARSSACFIAAATKEKEPDIAVLQIPQDRLDYAIGQVEYNAPRYAAIKRGEVVPIRCERCDYCRRTKVLTQVIDYRNI